MRNAASSFTEEDRKKVAAAVLESETRTSAEIVPAVASASGRYDRAEDIVGLIAGLGGMIVVWLVFQREDPAAGGWDGLPLAVGLPVLVPVMIAGFLVGAIVATRVGWLRRLFTPRGQMIEETNAAAAQLFHDSRIHHTAAASGVLVYLSLFERRAVILADRAAFDALGQTRIDELCRDLTRDLRQGDLTVAFCAVIKKLGDLLAEPLPREAGDENELSDALVTLE